MATQQNPRAGRNSARSPFAVDDWERVGETLRTIRELRGYKPEQLAALMGISRAYLANIEAGRKKLTEVNLARAASALQVRQIAILRPVGAAAPAATPGHPAKNVPGAAASSTRNPTKEVEHVRA
ncbi:helix-turn-helix domain-containing protein [Nocardia wallacei]|uniref:helix-turn-helix domain-containing protein n=1 Tax=Nocardia wallacei TaxID=480035 RepID=UPI003CC7EC21